MKEEIVTRVLEDSDPESGDARELVGYAGVAIIGIILFAYAVLAVFIPSTVAVFGLPTALDTGTGGIWGTASYYWLIALGASGVLAVISGVGGYVLETTGDANEQ
jgi:hypothetical protein